MFCFFVFFEPETVISDHEEKLPAASLCLQDAVQKKKKGGRVLPGSLPRCHGERGEWNNAHVTAAIRSFFSFRSKGLIGAVRSAVGTNNGGRAERAARGQREEAEEWIAQPPPLPTRSPPPACWINFGMDAPAVAREALRSRTSCVETKKKKEKKRNGLQEYKNVANAVLHFNASQDIC